MSRRNVTRAGPHHDDERPRRSSLAIGCERRRMAERGGVFSPLRPSSTPTAACGLSSVTVERYRRPTASTGFSRLLRFAVSRQSCVTRWATGPSGPLGPGWEGRVEPTQTEVLFTGLDFGVDYDHRERCRVARPVVSSSAAGRAEVDPLSAHGMVSPTGRYPFAVTGWVAA
jgi:hypothetical protein